MGTLNEIEAPYPSFYGNWVLPGIFLVLSEMW